MRGNKRSRRKGLASIILPQIYRFEISALTHHTEVHEPARSDCSYGEPRGCCLPGQCPSECTSAVPVRAFACASERRVILCSARCGLRANPTWCDICEGRQIIYVTLPLTGAAILI